MQLNAVHGNCHLRHVDFFLFAGKQIVVARQIGAGVADVAKVSAQRAVIVKAQAQGADGAVGGLQLDAHVHGNAQRGVDGALQGVGFDDGAARLVGEQVYRVRGVVPQQMVGPAAGLAQGVHIAAAKKIGLHVHLLDIEFARPNPVVHPLVAGVKAPGVAAHGHQAFFLGELHHFSRVAPAISQRNFHLHVLARAQAGQGLRRMHLRGRAQNHRIHFGQGQAIGQVGADVGDAVFARHFLRFFQRATHQRNHFYAFDILDSVQVLDAKGTGAR